MQPYALVQPGDSFDAWHHATCRNYSVTQSRPVADCDFRASVSVRPFGAVAISEIASEVRNGDGIEVTRSPSDIRLDPRDDFLLWVARGGTTGFEQAGRRVVLGPGDMVLHDQARPFSLTFASSSAAMMVVIPRALLTVRLPHADRLVAQRVARDLPLARLSASLARQVARSRVNLPVNAADRLCDAALDIWSTMLETTLAGSALDGEALHGVADTPASGPRARNRSRDRLANVQLTMRARMDDPDLDMETIAQAHHMSTRTLIRLFASEGDTPMRWLLAERLRACHDALAQGRVQRVTDAALTHGFSDLSHFSRCFRAAYGCTAQDVLRRR